MDSLQTQIDALAPGAELLLPPGTVELQSPLLLRRSLRLRGAPTTLRLTGGREAVIRLQGAGPFELQHLHVEYAAEGPGRGIWAEAGELHLLRCHVSGAHWVNDRGLGCGVHFSQESRGSVVFCELFQNDVGVLLDHQSQVRVESSRLNSNRLHGLRCQAYARLHAAQNECAQNGETGISLGGQSRGELDGNHCHDNGTHGILAVGQAQLRLQGNELSQNAHHGLSVEENAQAWVEGQVCEDNGLCGIDLGGDCRVQAHSNYCNQNVWHGIQVRDQAWPLLQGNRCRHNQHSGLAYYGKAGGCAQDHWLEENGEYAVQVSDQAQPLLSANRCTRNALSGLAYFGQASGLARQNQASHHPYHGVQTCDSAQPLLEQNVCQQNSLFGFACFGSSKPVLRSNQAEQNHQGGYYVGDQAEPQLWENQAHHNGVCGMQLVGRSAGLFVDNHLSSNGNHGLQIGPEAAPWLSNTSSSGHSVSETHCLSDHVVVLERLRQEGPRLAKGHRLQFQDGEGQPLELVLPFEPKASEKQVLEALARHGKLSESELSKVAGTRRIAGLLESLGEKLHRSGVATLENQGQGSEGAIYALRVRTH